jgi:hypothetical protein
LDSSYPFIIPEFGRGKKTAESPISCFRIDFDAFLRVPDTPFRAVISNLVNRELWSKWYGEFIAAARQGESRLFTS